MNLNEVLDKYPELFGTNFDPRQSLMGFGFETSDAWSDIIVSYLPELSEVVKDNDLDGFRILQIKEKFGILSIYSNFHHEEITKVIDKIEKECSITCERCGSKEGIWRQNKWYRITCNDCEDKE